MNKETEAKSVRRQTTATACPAACLFLVQATLAVYLDICRRFFGALFRCGSRDQRQPWSSLIRSINCHINFRTLLKIDNWDGKGFGKFLARVR